MTTAEKTANWWADQITTSKPNWNNGDQSPSGGMAFMLGNMVALSSRERIEEENVQQFKKLMIEKINEINSQGRTAIMGVDYHPDFLLAEIASQAGIPSTAFPCKTTTWTTEEEAISSLGYGAPRKVIEITN